MPRPLGRHSMSLGQHASRHVSGIDEAATASGRRFQSVGVARCGRIPLRHCQRGFASSSASAKLVMTTLPCGNSATMFNRPPMASM